MGNYTVEDKARDEISKEFPPLTAESIEVLKAAYPQTFDLSCNLKQIRRSLSAGINEAAIQAALKAQRLGYPINTEHYKECLKIADNLHTSTRTPSPLQPPTREQLEEALSYLTVAYGGPGGGNENTKRYLQILRSGIAYHCKVQP